VNVVTTSNKTVSSSVGGQVLAPSVIGALLVGVAVGATAFGLVMYLIRRLSSQGRWRSTWGHTTLWLAWL